MEAGKSKIQELTNSESGEIVFFLDGRGAEVPGHFAQALLLFKNINSYMKGESS
jgi:hypothetical protein